MIPEEILTDHPERYRALIVESANPAHSVADSPRIREALAALEFVLVSSRHDRDRPARRLRAAVATQFEKVEATLFNFEFPKNVFHLRRPLARAAAGPPPRA